MKTRARFVAIVFALAFVAANASGQTRRAPLKATTGTVIIVGVSHNAVVIAADSRVTAIEDGSTSDVACKISNFGGKIVFASSGLRGLERQKGVKTAWESHDFAQQALRRASHAGRDLVSVNDVAAQWARDSVAYFKRAIGRDGDGFRRDTSMSSRVIVAGMFAGADGKGGVTASNVVVMLGSSPKSKSEKLVTVQSETNSIHPDDELASVAWSALGQVDVPYEFLQHDSERADTLFRAWHDSVAGRSPAERLESEAARLVEWTELYARDDDVGGAVDEISIDSGGMRWLARKDACPASE